MAGLSGDRHAEPPSSSSPHLEKALGPRASGTRRVFLMPMPRVTHGTLCRVPEISRFLGIVIAMYYEEHGVPHFHAVYGEHRVSVEVQSGVVHV